MSKEKKELIPELRFPEFVEDGEWEETTLEQLADYENGKAHEKDIDEDGDYIVVNSKFISTEGETVKFSDTAFCPANLGDILMVLSDVPNGKAIAKCFYVNEDNKYSVNQRICRITPTDCDKRFLFYIMDRNPYFLSFDDGVKQTNLRKSDVLEFPFRIPTDPVEQKKIATCLSSLDELIAAHNDKLDALKDHKKGLMQNLIPQEGQKVPNYRFPEYEKNGEWVDRELGSMAIKVGSGKTPKGGDKNYKKKGRPFVRSQNVGWGCLLIDDIAFIDEETHSTFTSSEIKINDVLLNITGASIGRSAIANEKVEKGNVNQHVCIIRTKKDLNPLYLNQFIIANDGQRQIDSFQAGGNRQGLNFGQIRSLSIPLPPKLKEQQKIVSCFSTLDELITAQAKKIEQLKQHKKGLMQGLFPLPTVIADSIRNPLKMHKIE